MLLEEFALWINHLRLNPYTKLHSCLLSISYQSWYSLWQLALSGFPIAKTSMVVLTRILIGKPSVVEQEHIYTQVFGILHQLGKTLLVEIETSVLPVVKKSEAVAHTHVHLILTSPVVQIARSLTHTVVAHGEDKLRCCEHLASLQLIIGSVRIDGRNNTQSAHVIHLESEAEVARPSYCTEHHLALVLLGRLVKTKFEERLCLHCSTCAKFSVDNLLACAQLCGLGLSLLSPVTVVIGEVIF